MEMMANVVLNRYSGIAPEVEADGALMQVQRVGDTLVFSMGQCYVRKSCLQARLAGGAGVVVGLMLAQSSLWGWALAILGLLAFVFLPRLIRPARLLEIDGEQGVVRVVQPAVGAGTVVSIVHIVALNGVYETQGWDPRSVIFALLDDGTTAPLLVLSGTDEALAEYTCRTLGLLLNRTATYIGPFDTTKTCYTSS